LFKLHRKNMKQAEPCPVRQEQDHNIRLAGHWRSAHCSSLGPCGSQRNDDSFGRHRIVTSRHRRIVGNGTCSAKRGARARLGILFRRRAARPRWIFSDLRLGLYLCAFQSKNGGLFLSVIQRECPLSTLGPANPGSESDAGFDARKMPKARFRLDPARR